MSIQSMKELMARVAHEVNRAYCQATGDNSQPSWNDAPQWQKDSALSGVAAHLASELTPEQSHELWLEQKRKDGWRYGVTKDAVEKTHPCFCDYNALPKEQRAKDFLFRAVVTAFKEGGAS